MKICDDARYRLLILKQDLQFKQNLIARKTGSTPPPPRVLQMVETMLDTSTPETVIRGIYEVLFSDFNQDPDFKQKKLTADEIFLLALFQQYEIAIKAKEDVEKWFINKLYQEAADQNHIHAIVELALMNEWRSLKDSYEMYKKAAALALEQESQGIGSGISLADYCIAHCFEAGHGIEWWDEKRAFKHMKKAADKNIPLALANLSWYYYRGIGTECDLVRGNALLHRASDCGHIEASGTLARMYRRGDTYTALGNGIKDLHLAVMYYERAVQAVNPYAHESLAELYLNGVGVKRNFKRAFELYRDALQQTKRYVPRPSDYYLENILAFFYLNGIGTTRNAEMALELLRKGVSMQNVESMVFLGEVYAEGLGDVTVDVRRARPLFLQAVAHGCKRAQIYLARLNIKQNTATETALRTLKSWVSKKDKLAQYEWARHLEQSHPEQPPAVSETACYVSLFKRDLRKAYFKNQEKIVKLYRASAEAGCELAKIKMAELHRSGQLGVERDPKKTLQYYQECMRIPRWITHTRLLLGLGLYYKDHEGNYTSPTALRYYHLAFLLEKNISEKANLLGEMQKFFISILADKLPGLSLDLIKMIADFLYIPISLPTVDPSTGSSIISRFQEIDVEMTIPELMQEAPSSLTFTPELQRQLHRAADSDKDQDSDRYKEKYTGESKANKLISKFE